MKTPRYLVLATVVAVTAPGYSLTARNSADPDTEVATILAFDEKLKSDPFDHEALRRMIQAHEALMQQPAPVESAPVIARHGDDADDLPDLIPSEHPEQQASAKISR